MESKGIALVTGASAGLGAEFARQLAASGHDLVLVARDRERLEASAQLLRAVHGVTVEVLAADLLSDEGLQAVEARLGITAEGSAVEMLVNNAGFGLPRPFDTTPIADELRHLKLLVEVPMRLSHAALTPMLERGHGTIVNVASVAGFVPRGTYGAAKAWVLSFSRWAHAVYAPRGVLVTAIAPGFVRTEFHERMGVPMKGVPRPLWLRAEQLVRLALVDVDKGKAVSVPTLRYKVAVALASYLPSSLVTRLASMGRDV